MRTLQLEKTSASFRKTASLAEKEVIVLTKNGRPALALVGLKDEMTLEALSLGGTRRSCRTWMVSVIAQNADERIRWRKSGASSVFVHPCPSLGTAWIERDSDQGRACFDTAIEGRR